MIHPIHPIMNSQDCAPDEGLSPATPSKQERKAAAAAANDPEAYVQTEFGRRRKPKALKRIGEALTSPLRSMAAILRKDRPDKGG